MKSYKPFSIWERSQTLFMIQFKRTAVYSTRWVLNTVETLTEKNVGLVQAPPLAKSGYDGAV